MATPFVAKALQKLLPKTLPPSLSAKPGNLYQVLARYPRDGVGQHVYQTRWSSKGIEGCYWQITRASLKHDGAHGKAWGRLIWRGKDVSPHEERIKGGLKYTWSQGVSQNQRPRGSQS
ncbi:hypothetical protein BV25DRAFT_68392 [Artomyces pyxidatus]|uniref:Uncharacterized protein n=1 Tax=Artomyces pyxidatus TaxID=48021 RepID=A0ACB8TKM2_9AGAM|nr:hypothetical protein BV25DRAFT_68392 [Artomyces pyxidatus]